MDGGASLDGASAVTAAAGNSAVLIVSLVSGCSPTMPSRAATDGKLDLPALKQMLHLVMQGMHSAALDDEP
jgi:hypothetical protein